MFDFIKSHQLDLMLFLCGGCGILFFLLIHTRFLSKRRKVTLILMEMIAFFLLWFDRLAYIYAGDPSQTGFVMVRVSNFVVFFLTSAIVFVFNLYIIDLFSHEGNFYSIPLRLNLVAVLSLIGMLLSVVSAFTNLYYYFDEANLYHRGKGFLIAYIIPVICPLIQFTVIRQNKKILSKLIYVSLLLYIFVPIAFGIIQIFTYGISLVNMTMVAVSVSLYIFTYLDINNTVEHAHEIEIQSMRGEKERMQKMFDRTAEAFVSEVEKKDGLVKGNSILTADYARRIAKKMGKSDAYCDKVYYAAMFSSVGLSGISNKIIDIKKDESDIMEKISKVAGDYVDMTRQGKNHEAVPDYVAREELLKGAGEKYDSVLADIMVRLIDSNKKTEAQDSYERETEIVCGEYRSQISKGIEINRRIKKIRFNSVRKSVPENGFGSPSIILFDSLDRHAHSNNKSIEENRYVEYGEIWFDDHMISTAARKMETVKINQKKISGDKKGQNENPQYEITVSRFEDHIKLEMSSPSLSKEIIVALPDRTKSAYVGLTGEHCEIQNIVIETTKNEIGADDIPKIVNGISYINHLESDIKNVQIDRTRSASTNGIEIKKHLKLSFHSMSLPSASLIWHCPYVVIFYSKDGTVNGPDYREYALIKMNGENDGEKDFALTKLKMKKKDDFPGWDTWTSANKFGFDYDLSFEKKGRHVIFKSENLGISLESITAVMDSPEKIFVALTGDQVALTDIRIR